jgi:glycosyltransferase involved in cell wall biosynthesis
LAVVVPAFNEAASIRALIRRLEQQADRIIVVDDGSTDGTANEVADRAVTLIRHEHNQGKGAALTSGIRAATASDAAAWIATVDGDGQHNPEQLTTLLAYCRQYPDALVLGARTGKATHAPWSRRFANGVADFFISWAAQQRVTDTQTGLRVYPAAALIALMDQGRIRSSGFGWEAEALIELARAGTPIIEVTVAAIYNHSGSPSHYRPARDSAIITLLVGRRLLARGLDPVGLLRSRRKRR